MGTGGQNFDIQNFFKSSPSPSPSPTPSAPYNLPNHPNHPNHPYPLGGTPFPPQNSYPASSPTPGSFPFPTQGYSYMHYSQEMPRPAPYPSAPFIQPPFSQSVVAPMPQSAPNQVPHSQASVSSPPLDGARLMALLTTQSTGDLRNESSGPLLSHPSALELPPAAVSSSGSQGSIEASEAPPAISPALPSAPPVSLAPQSSNLRASGKLPKGRHLNGERVVYDIDNRMRGEEQPQLEVSPITVYSSEPVLVVGRQIAVNKSYICYGLRAGTIRVLNINTASRSLLRGHTQRVIDMTFLANDVHVLASSSIEGRVFVRRIEEGPGEDGKNQITEQLLTALQFLGDWESCQPRVCWHPRQDTLVVGIWKYVLTVDITRFRGSAEDPIKCNVKNPVEGVRVLGTHENEVTGLAACPGTLRFASCSKDGTVRIWGETQLMVLAPHAMSSVNSVAFLSAPRRYDQVVLLTAGPLNKELKLWASVGADGSTWKCIQTLELKSSLEKKVEDAFFNQMVIVPHASLVLLANAKRNAIYVVHVEFGQAPSSARMDYLAEFSVKMPILSFTATSDNLVDGEGSLQVYCVQTQAIQQYSLDLAMCLPPVQEGKSDALGSDTFTSGFTAGAPQQTTPKSNAEKAGMTTPMDSVAVTANKGKAYTENYPAIYEAKEKEQYNQEKPVPDSDHIDKAVLSSGSLEASEPVLPAEVKNEVNEKEEKDSVTPTSSKQSQPHLITPSELMSMVARSKSEVPAKAANAPDEEAKIDGESGHSDSKVTREGFEERRRSSIESTDPLIDALEGGGNAEIQVSEAIIQNFPVVASEGTQQVDETELADDRSLGMEDTTDLKEVSSKAADYSTSSVSQSPAAFKGRKNKNKANAGVAVQAPSSSTSAPEAEASAPTVSLPSEGLAGQVQEALNQLQKDLLKQLPLLITVPIAKEGKRMETSMGQRLEKLLKANVDAMYAKQQEEIAKREKADRERTQQLITTLTNNIVSSTKELPASIERVLKKELTTLVPAVAKAVSPSIEKAVATALIDSSQNLNEKTVTQLEKTVSSKLEGYVARQMQSQFQTTGKQALQDAMRTCFEGSVVPSFERSCRAMFEQVDAAFQKGMAEHTSHAQQQVSASHSALASSFQDSVNSLAQTLKSELADSQRKLAALAETRYNFPVKQASGALPEKVLSLQHVEETLDPTIEISRNLSQGKLEEAFNRALSLSDVAVVSWLINQVDPATVFSTSPPLLSQGVLLSLVQQLGCDLGKDTARKLNWIQEAALNINPSDPVLAPHMRSFLDQLYQNLHRQVRLTPPGELANSLRLVVHVVNSLLSSCK